MVLQVSNFARVADSIVGWGGSIGKWARIENKSVVGEDVHIKVCLTARLQQIARHEKVQYLSLWSRLSAHDAQGSGSLHGGVFLRANYACVCLSCASCDPAGRGVHERHDRAAAQGD